MSLMLRRLMGAYAGSRELRAAVEAEVRRLVEQKVEARVAKGMGEGAR